MFIVHLAGHLGKDPETRFTPSGQKVTTFSMAINHRKGKEDVTSWVRVTIWGDRFDKLVSFLKKGSGIIVTGKMNPPSSYTDKEGRTQVTLEVTAEMIEFSPFGRGDRQGDSQQQANQPYGGGNSASQEASSQYDMGEFKSNQNSQYGKGQFQYASGQSQQYSMEEDKLPF